MDYNGFVFYCFNQGIDPEVVKAYRKPVMDDSAWCLHGDGSSHPKSDLGHTECGDIQTVAQGIAEIKDAIWCYTCDVDEMGRDISKLRHKQLIKRANQFPFNKRMVRVLAKTYYLLDGVAD